MADVKFVDFFCGAGGLSQGLILAGLKCILGVDNDKFAIKTFQHNHKTAKTFCGTIQEIDQDKLKELIGDNVIDVAAFGVPCQAFSTIGKNDPEDKRRNLFHESMRIVKLISPKIVVMENVTGITSQKNRVILEAIFKEFVEHGYNVDAKILSAQDYGVPQCRRRTFIIGVKKEIGYPIYPEIVCGEGKSLYMTVEDAFLKMQKGLKNHDLSKTKITNYKDEEIIAHIPPGKGIRYKKDVEKYLPQRLWPEIDWSKLPEGRLRQERYKRIDATKPSPTILTGKSTYYHPKECRFLTVREAATIQSFPSYFEFFGSSSAQWKQVGNAVPPRLASSIGQAIKKILNFHDDGNHEVDIGDILGHLKGAFFYKRNKKEKK